MKSLRFDQSAYLWIAVVGIAASFYLFVHRPSSSAIRQSKEQIALAEQTLQNIPLRVAELRGLQHQAEQRRAYLKEFAKAIPSHPDQSQVVSTVARLAEKTGLKQQRLEPLPVEQHHTYDTCPYRVAVSGRFADVQRFVAEFESQPRVVGCRQLTVQRERGGLAETVTVELIFEVYAVHADFADFADFGGSSAAAPSDT